MILCRFALLSLCLLFFFPTLMLTQETFSILPQERRGKLLSSGLKVSLLFFSSSVSSYDWWGGHPYTSSLRELCLVARIRYLNLFQTISLRDDLKPLIEIESSAVISMALFSSHNFPALLKTHNLI